MVSLSPIKYSVRVLHIVVVSFDGKGEAAMDVQTVSFTRASQGAAREHRLLLLIEAYGREFLPVANQLVFNNDHMNSKFPLRYLSQESEMMEQDSRREETLLAHESALPSPYCP